MHDRENGRNITISVVIAMMLWFGGIAGSVWAANLTGTKSRWVYVLMVAIFLIPSFAFAYARGLLGQKPKGR